MTRKRAGATVRVNWQACSMLSSAALVCPLCQTSIPPNTLHECSSNGGVPSVRNRPVPEGDVIDVAIDTAIKGPTS